MPVTSDDYWVVTSYTASPLRELLRTDEAAVFAWLSSNLPVVGTKIDWDKVGETHEHWHLDDEAALQALAREEVCSRVQRCGPAVHAGDGLSPTGVHVPHENCANVIAALLAIPEHHYFLASDHTWLVVVTTEGDLDTLDFR